MQTILLCINFLVFLLFWHTLWQKTLLDSTRDRFFDLRNQVRSWFIKNDHGIDDTVYHALRGRINLYLRDTEQVSALSFLSFIIADSISKDFSVNITHSNHEFESPNRNITAFAKKVRNDAARILLKHMVLRSLFLSSILVMLMAILFVIATIYALYKSISELSCCGDVLHRSMNYMWIGILMIVTLVGCKRIESYSSSIPPTYKSECHS